MRELNHAIASNYIQHTAFSFTSPALQLSAELLRQFNEAYIALCKTSSSLDANSCAIALERCTYDLDQVFRSLISQTEDSLLISFLAELQAASRNLMNQEVNWYAKPRNGGFVRILDDRVRDCVIKMHSQRYFFGRLSANTVARIWTISRGTIEKLRVNAANGRFTREDLSVNSGPCVRAIRNLLNQEFKSQGVLDAMSAYTGRKMRVSGLALELSAPQASWWRNAIPGLDRAPHTLYAHLDETVNCPKSIVYLTDVTNVNGPTGCYPHAYESFQLNPLQEIIGRVVGTVGNGADSVLKDYYAKTYHQSVSSENFRRHFMQIPESMRFNSHLGWDVLPGSDLESRLAGGEQVMTGPAGTFIAFDGARLLHRGGLMQSGERVALQVVFSDTTVQQEMMSRIKRVFS